MRRQIVTNKFNFLDHVTTTQVTPAVKLYVQKNFSTCDATLHGEFQKVFPVLSGLSNFIFSMFVSFSKRCFSEGRQPTSFTSQSAKDS